MNMESFLIGEWLVTPAEGTLSRDGQIVRLEPRVMEVLVYFSSRPGEVVTRTELEEDVWRGALVGYDAVTATIIKLRKALKDNAKNPRYIVTVPKKGYQLIASVSAAKKAEDLQPAQTTKFNSLNTSLKKVFNTQATTLIGLILIVVALLISWNLQTQPDRQYTDPPSLLVLPFENIGTGEKHDVFVDGLTEDVITDLSRLSNLQVMSSNTSFEYKGQQPTPKELNKKFNVDLIIKSSARRHINEIRINIELINAKTGFNIWASRFERKLEDLFSLQDEITQQLIDRLSIQLTPEEKQRLAQRSTNNFIAYDFFLEGQRVSKTGTRQSNQLSADAYRKAIEVDSTYGRAYGALAFILTVDFRRGWTDRPLETLDRALALAEKGVALDDTIPQTHWVLGYVHLMRKEHKKAEQAVNRAINIASNYADGYGLLALIHNNLGDPKKAIVFAEKGMKINPYFTWDYLFNLGLAHYTLGDHARAIEALESAQERNENAVPIKLYLAASYAQAGRLEDAEWIVEQLRVLDPMTTISHTNNAVPITKPEIKKQLLDDLRKAGLPE